MKPSTIPSNRGKTVLASTAFKGRLAAVLLVLVGVSWDGAICRAQQPDNAPQGAQVLTRGPVHEAFAGIITFNPEPGIVVTKAPPEAIEELPPEEKPEGDNVTWIPGYWAWDDERSDFLWVSGTWRALPPGRQWMAGYWGNTTQGFQWTSGYWADAMAREATYLPPPPVTVEVGPNIAAPSAEYGWTPGCWIWYQSRYAWRPGYWAPGRADWDWTPARYVWTPRGCIYVGGFWDYPVERRGLLFAPVYFEPGVYSRRDYYSPGIVIDLSVFSDHLFLRPHYSHYYFGDYYAPNYYQGGFYASFSFQFGHYGYDPIYSHQRWEHRQDREWEHRAEMSYQYRRDHEAARPPRTWAAQRAINPNTMESRQNRIMVATPIDQLAKRKDSSIRMQPVASTERQQLALRGQEVQQSRAQRQILESKPVDTTSRKPGRVTEPVKVQLPRSPIVAKPVNQMGKNQAPPKPQQAPKPDFKPQAQAATPDRAATPAREPNPTFSPSKARPEAVRSAPIGERGLPASKAAQQSQMLPRIPATEPQRVPPAKAKHEQITSEQGRPKMNSGENNNITRQRADPALSPSSR